MHNYTRQIFNTLTQKEKRAFIDRLIDSKLDLNKKELKIATKDQLERYFKGKFNMRRHFEEYELKYLDYEQILKFLDKNNNMIELYVLKYVNEKQKIEIIKKIANSKFPLDPDELHQLKSSERKIYAKARFNGDWGYLMRVFTVKYLGIEDQKKFIDMSLESGRSLSKEMVDVLKAPAKKYYWKSLQIHEFRQIKNITTNKVIKNLIS